MIPTLLEPELVCFSPQAPEQKLSNLFEVLSRHHLRVCMCRSFYRNFRFVQPITIERRRKAPLLKSVEASSLLCFIPEMGKLEAFDLTGCIGEEFEFVVAIGGRIVEGSFAEKRFIVKFGTVYVT